MLTWKRWHRRRLWSPAVARSQIIPVDMKLIRIMLIYGQQSLYREYGNVEKPRAEYSSLRQTSVNLNFSAQPSSVVAKVNRISEEKSSVMAHTTK